MDPNIVQYLTRYHPLDVRQLDPNIVDLTRQSSFDALTTQFASNRSVIDDRGYYTRIAWLDRKETAPQPFVIQF